MIKSVRKNKTTGKWEFDYKDLKGKRKIKKGFKTKVEAEKARAKRDLKILIEKLHEILLYVEPAQTCLKVYGHKIRELLILACTECENAWASYMRFAGNNNARLTTNDYVKLKKKLFFK